MDEAEGMKSIIRRLKPDEHSPFIPGIGYMTWVFILPSGYACYCASYEDCWIVYDMGVKSSLEMLTQLESSVVM
jgi:hypothetical protein